ELAAGPGDDFDPDRDHRRGRALVPRARRAAAGAQLGHDAELGATVPRDGAVDGVVARPRDLPAHLVVQSRRRRPARPARPARLLAGRRAGPCASRGRWHTRAMTWTPDPNAFRGRVAVVAGATRGAGRGIAAALGEAGATVICTGRTTRSARSEYNPAEALEETAELVTRLGGCGSAIALDHLDHAGVKALAAEIRAAHGHVDVLVNNIWGGELLKRGPAQWNTPIWKLDLDDGLRILRLAV